MLFTAPGLQLAKLKAIRIGEEQAHVVGTVSLFDGRQCAVKFEGLRSLDLIHQSDTLLMEGPISYSIFKPTFETDISKFLQEGEIIEATYLGDSVTFMGQDKIAESDYSHGAKIPIDEPWECAHLIFSMISNNLHLPPLVYQEIRMFAPVDDIWNIAEALGKDLEKSKRKLHSRSEVYSLKFVGVREAQSISGPLVYTVPVDPTEASHSKFEVCSDQDLDNLLNGADTPFNLLPATLCNIQMSDAIGPYLPPAS